MTTSIASSATQTIISAGTNPNALVLDATGIAQVGSINGGQLAGLRNRIINGDMRIDQRNAGASVTPVATAYTLDRFQLGASVASKLSIQQVADAPPGFKYSLKATVAAQYAPLAGDQFYITQKVEGHSLVDFQCGLAGAQVITISLWVKGSVAGTYACSFINGPGNRSYVGTITVTTAWAKQAVTLTCDTTGTWPTDSVLGAYLSIDFGSGTAFNAAAGMWAAGAFFRTTGCVTLVNQLAGSTLNITGMQVELGPVATPFEQRPIGMELALCQRYYCLVGTSARIQATAAGQYIQASYNTAPMRATPTAALVSQSTGNAGSIAFSTNNAYSGRLEALSVAVGDCYVINRIDSLSAEL